MFKPVDEFTELFISKPSEIYFVNDTPSTNSMLLFNTKYVDDRTNLSCTEENEQKKKSKVVDNEQIEK